MSVGIYALIIGLFKLGFLLEFVSIPVLTGFISATGIVIMLGQIPSLFGVKVGTGTATIIHDLFAQIPHFQGATMGIGFGSLALLIILEKVGAIWGKKNKVAWYFGLGRSAAVLILFTGISYGVNKSRVAKPVWELSKVKSDGIASPAMPSTELISKVFAKSIAPFLAATIEHLAIAKAFGRRNGYTINAAQELVYLGVTNFFNSFFSSMPVGGAMSRTAVNSATGVKSPASGLIAGSFVILAIFKLTPALFWIPKATLAAIIVAAVMNVISSPSVFYKYWKTSLVDFITAMIAFWVTLFVGTEAGIGASVGFNIVYYILVWAFTQIHRISSVPVLPAGANDHTQIVESKPHLGYRPGNNTQPIPADVEIFKPTQSIIFFNAYHVKQECLDVVQTYHSCAALRTQGDGKDRSWSVSGAQRLTILRKRAGIVEEPIPIRIVVLDFNMVQTIDTTGLTALMDFREDLEIYAGKGVEIKFIGVGERLRSAFGRFGWALVDAGSLVEEGGVIGEGGIRNKVYTGLGQAIWERHERADEGEMKIVGTEKV